MKTCRWCGEPIFYSTDGGWAHKSLVPKGGFRFWCGDTGDKRVGPAGAASESNRGER